MKMAELSHTFWQQGYVVIEDFFSVESMNSLHSILLGHYGLNPEYEHDAAFLSKSATEVIPWFPQRSGEQAFDEIEQCNHMETLTESILGRGWKALYCMAMFSKKGTKGQAWHQDCPPDDPQQFNLNRLVYTMDIDDQVGGEVLVMPGSHRLGKLPASEVNENFSEQVMLTPKKGTLVIIHGHTWHRVLPIKGEYRLSTNYRAVPQNTPEDITDICVYRNMLYQFSTSKVLEDRLV
ncbi:phytanoyl-CoA dioxygenase family protein [Paraglaciecola sp. MB-3u-78]|jgi:ectoine hydroxylase|uniref:phytanoyl-CoA dioxygenase family protein n=1 Tax=Paraglaciecola sp. MB-3u-78 TaxID=2058332 RepID=UPI000C34C638|nr:phytanoyl-CoA dioxygenase family protein [Paraglaciecola sp. MB-3u-78]PKH00376.1 phytanoyl-CoA dioxygenase [Paraglaciecola sp. MB-3u-78]